MERNQAKQLLPVIQAYAEGKTIQSRYIKGDTSLWYDNENPSFDDDDLEYRIKPESKYRPFANAEECWKEMFNHKPFGWIKDKVNNRRILITSVDSGVWGNSLNGNKGWSMEGLMRNFTFADGTPFGVKEEE